MAFDGPAGLPCKTAEPFHAWPLAFMETIGDEQPSMRREKRVASLQKCCQLLGGVQETAACKSIADNDIIC